MPVHVTSHPMIQHKLTVLRRKETPPKDFRELVVEITTCMAYEATREFHLREVDIETPLMKARLKGVIENGIIIMPILRAGLGMVDGMLRLFPDARVGHIGIYREHDTLKPVEYYCKFPQEMEGDAIFLIDPMLATGGSACAAIEFMKTRGIPGSRIKFLCILAAPEGVAAVEEAHPDVDIYVAAIDSRLNEQAYILPGLGDAGDRMFGT
ncbi:MAG: uracil phosphoribosyltransferase [Candidatus Eremiobacteraeota bacterium]|nr:uracil phosphoribosyltransferase [Candidatus Eremiobacteraeota bacterium]